MGISPWYKTATPTAPLWTIPLVPDSGPFNIAGLSTSNFALLFKNLDTGIETNGVGSFNNLTAASTNSAGVLIPASIQYQVASGDIPATVPAHFRVVVLITFSNGIEPYVFEEDWEVLPL